MDLQERGKHWVASCRKCHLRIRLSDAEEVAWKAALTVADDPDILRRSLLNAADTKSIEQSGTTLESLVLNQA